jgi:hypothetical protein
MPAAPNSNAARAVIDAYTAGIIAESGMYVYNTDIADED